MSMLGYIKTLHHLQTIKKSWTLQNKDSTLLMYHVNHGENRNNVFYWPNPKSIELAKNSKYSCTFVTQQHFF